MCVCVLRAHVSDDNKRIAYAKSLMNGRDVATTSAHSSIRRSIIKSTSSFLCSTVDLAIRYLLIII